MILVVKFSQAIITNIYSLVSTAISSANTLRQSPFCGKTKGGLEPTEPYASYAPACGIGKISFERNYNSLSVVLS